MCEDAQQGSKKMKEMRTEKDEKTMALCKGDAFVGRLTLHERLR